MAIFKWKLLTTIYEVFATFNTNTRLLIPSNALSLSLNIVVYLRERETGKKTFLSSLVPNMWLDGSVGSGAQQVTGRHGFESRWSRCFFFFQAYFLQLSAYQRGSWLYLTNSNKISFLKDKSPQFLQRKYRCSNNTFLVCFNTSSCLHFHKHKPILG